MPRHTRKFKGCGIMDFMKKANNWLRKTKIVSKLGNAYGKYGGMAGLPYTAQVGQVAGMADKLGYGRRRRRVRRGAGLRLAGSGLRLAGSGMRRPMHF